jgi:hypothetical protein
MNRIPSEAPQMLAFQSWHFRAGISELAFQSWHFNAGISMLAFRKLQAPRL